jgi:dTMP kinase
MNNGIFITLEGIEGVGKTSNLHFVRDWLLARGLSVYLTREPGGTPLAEEIRHLLLTPRDEKVAADAELLLMFAARSQHVETVIKPKLAQGQCVLSDRFVDASYAYQGGGRGIPVSRLQQLERWTLGDFRPHLTILLDLDPITALQRAKARSAADRFEQETVTFFEAARAHYLQRAHNEPQRFIVIDASVPLVNVQQQIASVLQQRWPT